MSKLLDIVYGLFKIGGVIAGIIKNAKKEKRKKKDEKTQSELEHIIDD